MSDPQPISKRSDRSGRRLLLVWGAILILSGSGIGAGAALLIRKPAPPPIDPSLAGPDHGPPDFSPGPIVSRMARDLELSPEQTQQVTKDFTQTLTAMKALRADMVVKAAAEHEKLRAAMRKTLTDAQFAKWDQRFEAMRFREMPDGPPPRDFRHHGPGGDMDDRDGPRPGPGMMRDHRPGPDGPDDGPDGGLRGRHPPIGPPGNRFGGDQDRPPLGPGPAQDDSGPRSDNAPTVPTPAEPPRAPQ